MKYFLKLILYLLILIGGTAGCWKISEPTHQEPVYSTVEPLSKVETPSLPTPTMVTIVEVTTQTMPTVLPTQDQYVIHIVKAGETLYSIAKSYGTTWSLIAELNGITEPTKLSVGQQLYVPNDNVKSQPIEISEGSSSGSQTELPVEQDTPIEPPPAPPVSTGTNVFINGIEATVEVLYLIETLNGEITPGRYFWDVNGNFGPEGASSWFELIVNTLYCEGLFFNEPASITGKRVSSPYGIGEEAVSFLGVLTATGLEHPMEYSGYLATAPYDGYIYDSQGQSLFVGVLDRTSSVIDNNPVSFIIYDGQPSLNAPDIYGEFNCNWNQ